MFVTAQDFDVPPFSIPNLDSVENTFPDYIDAKEQEILKRLLGGSFYDSFVDGLNAFTPYDGLARTVGVHYSYNNDVWEALTVTAGITPVEGVDWTLVEANNRWLLLKNGNSYLHGGQTGPTYNWIGMTEMLKPFIFANWLRDTFDNYSGVGVTIANSENSSVSDPSRRIVEAFNKFCTYAGRKGDHKNTLYGYLYQAGELQTFEDSFDMYFGNFLHYVESNFDSPKKMNYFNL